MRSLIVVAVILASVAMGAGGSGSAGSMTGKSSETQQSSVMESSAMSSSMGISSAAKGSKGAMSSGHMASGSGATTAPATTTAAPSQPPTPACKTGVFGNDQIASLFDYAAGGAMKVAVNGTMTYYLSPCSSIALTTADKACTGYAANFADGKCGDLYTKVYANAAFTNDATQYWTVSWATADNAKILNAWFICDETMDGTTGVLDASSTATGALIKIRTYKVCSAKNEAPITLAKDTCSTSFTRWNRTFDASLSGFQSQAKTVNGNAISISPCSKTTFPGCGEATGYMAINKSTDGSCVVLSERTASYDPINLEFTSTFTVAAAAPLLKSTSSTTLKDKDTQRIVVVKCGATDSETGTMVGDDTIVFTSTSACAEEQETKSGDNDGLSGGIIALIIILIVVVVVLVAGIIFKVCSSSRRGSDGEYNEVGMDRGDKV